MQFLKNPKVALGLYLVGMFMIPINDSIMKNLSPDMALFEFMFVRAGFMLMGVLAIPATYFALRQLGPMGFIQVFARGSLMSIALALLFLSISMVPIASAYAVFFTAPIIISVASVPILGERLTIIRVMSVVLGLVGVLFITKPWQADFSAWFLVALAAAFVYASYQIVTRLLPMNVKVGGAMVGLQLAYLFWTGLAALAIYYFGWQNSSNEGLDFLTRNWMPLNLNLWLTMIFCAIITLVWAYSATNAYFSNEASFVAPFEYSALPLSALWGYFLLQEVPSFSAAIGMAIIIAAGVLMAFERPQAPKEATQKA